MAGEQRERIEVICVNTGERHFVEPGMTLEAIRELIGMRLNHTVIGAKVNNRLRDLRFRAYTPVTVEFIDITDTAGIRMYTNSLFFLLQKAVREELPECRLWVQHSVSKGFYCEIQGHDGPLSYELISRLHERMQRLVARDVPFESSTTLTKDAIEIFSRQGDMQKVRLLQSRRRLYTTLNGLDGIWDYYYEALVPSTGYLECFDLVKYYDGMLLMVPQRKAPEELEELVLQPMMFDIFQEYRQWVRILGIEDAGTINQRVKMPTGACTLIQVSEALHEKKVATIADAIASREPGIRVVLVAGPSSSGKTTFSKRLAVQLMVSGMTPHMISLDNYFVDREKTPRDASGEYDFEAFDALDIERFNDDLQAMMRGEKVELPKFSFKTGKRYFDGDFLTLEKRGVLIIEGIHALNPKLSERIPQERKFKVYLSALTSISLDGLNRIASSDNRLLRRMVRDYQYRGYSAVDTIRRWNSVRRGEDRNIFPFQEEADVMFNSALPYEFGVLKRLAEPILQEVPNFEKEYSEAVRLLRFLEFFEPISDESIPPTSILREFLGGSSFKYE